MNIFEQLQHLSPTKSELFRLLLEKDGIDISLLPITKCETTDTPLSYVQQSLLFIHQLTPESSAYNREHALHIKGDLNISVLRKTLEYLLQRHDILRTAYNTKGNIACQHVIDDIDISLGPDRKSVV